MAKQVKKQIKKASKESKLQSKNKKKGAARTTSRAKSKVVKKKVISKKKQLKKVASKVSSSKGQKAKKKVLKETKQVKKKPLKKAGKSKANNPLLKPVTLSPELAVIVGGQSKLPRTEVVKRIWQYIKKHNLQDPKDKKRIRADQKLKVVFQGKSSVDMFELTKVVSKHLRA